MHTLGVKVNVKLNKIIRPITRTNARWTPRILGKTRQAVSFCQLSFSYFNRKKIKIPSIETIFPLTWRKKIPCECLGKINTHKILLNWICRQLFSRQLIFWQETKWRCKIFQVNYYWNRQLYPVKLLRKFVPTPPTSKLTTRSYFNVRNSKSRARTTKF